MSFFVSGGKKSLKKVCKVSSIFFAHSESCVYAKQHVISKTTWFWPKLAQKIVAIKLHPNISWLHISDTKSTDVTCYQTLHICTAKNFHQRNCSHPHKVKILNNCKVKYFRIGPYKLYLKPEQTKLFHLWWKWISKWL